MQIGVWQSGACLLFIFAPGRWQEKSCNFYIWDGHVKRAQLCQGDPDQAPVNNMIWLCRQLRFLGDSPDFTRGTGSHIAVGIALALFRAVLHFVCSELQE